MAIRNILLDSDEFLRKQARPVTDFNERLWQLLDDMAETMYDANGIGLAAPQVGVLRRVFVADVDDELIEAINPKIVRPRGNQEEIEGCLSSPGEYGITRRPQSVKLKAQDRYGKDFVLEAEELLARCLCHENDHLDGILFKDNALRMLSPEELEELSE